MFKLTSTIACLLLAAICSTDAKPELSALFGDHAVLQRDCEVPIWGNAAPGEALRVTVGGRTTDATANEQGYWRVTLPAMEAGVTGDLVVSSTSGTTTSRDILVGDVWLCSGQSNMERPVRMADNLEQEKADAEIPEIRHFKVIPNSSSTPLREPRGKWEVCSPATVERFTAIGYFFARELYQETQVPQGLINCTKGGTRIESWINPEGLVSDDSLAVVMERWNEATAAYPEKLKTYEKELEAWKQAKDEAELAEVSFGKKQPRKPKGEPGGRGMPSSLYNAMAYPVLQYPVKAVIWYQGESNWQHPREYGRLLRGLIHGWRERSGNETLPFLIIQLPIYGTDDTHRWPVIREGQASAAEEVPFTSLVVTIDLGDSKNIHPTNKQAFAERLLRVIHADIFGKDTIAQGPRIISAVREGSAMRVTITEEDDLVLLDSPGTLGSFELAGSDRVFYPAHANLHESGILVESPEVRDPVALRYAWRAGPTSILFNGEGLPAAPFRTDNWIDR